MGIFTIMFLIFMTLKLTNYIDWSWWFITMPLWGGFIFLIIVGVFMALIGEAGSKPKFPQRPKF